MTTTYYVKEGRKYKPVAEYDEQLMASVPYGNTLIISQPNRRMRRFNIDPDHAPLLAALETSTDEITSIVVDAMSDIRQTAEYSDVNNEVWQKFKDELQGQLSVLYYPSAYDITRKLHTELVRDAVEIMENPSVKQAYENFKFVYELARNHENK